MGIRSCDGEFKGRVIIASEGDGAWSSPVYLVEDEETSCGCALTDEEWATARDKLVEACRDVED
jgi:hypothetical protein